MRKILKITRISIYRKDLTYVGSQYVWGRGNVIEVGKSTIVNIETDSGLSGVGVEPDFDSLGDPVAVYE